MATDSDRGSAAPRYDETIRSVFQVHTFDSYNVHHPDRCPRCLAHAALDALLAERDRYREALQRIALGVEGRRNAGVEERVGGLPAADWQLAREALGDV